MHACKKKSSHMGGALSVYTACVTCCTHTRQHPSPLMMEEDGRSESFVRSFVFQGPLGQTHTHKPRKGVRGRRSHRPTHEGGTDITKIHKKMNPHSLSSTMFQQPLKVRDSHTMKSLSQSVSSRSPAALTTPPSSASAVSFHTFPLVRYTDRYDKPKRYKWILIHVDMSYRLDNFLDFPHLSPNFCGFLSS